MSVNIRLGDLAYARSGDKGSGANVAIIANNQKIFLWLQAHLTDALVETYFAPFGVGKVTRYELPRLFAFNFILPGILSNPARRSLRNDAQGKALGQVLLELPLVLSQEEHRNLLDHE